MGYLAPSPWTSFGTDFYAGLTVQYSTAQLVVDARLLAKNVQIQILKFYSALFILTA